MIQEVYNRTLRPYLPRKLGVFRGVTVRAPRLFDFTDVLEGYEEEYVDAITEAVSEGDHVVLLGGGRGVSTVWAARLAGESGKVDVYEAAANRVADVRETLNYNVTPGVVDLRNAVVGDEIAVWGDASEAERVSPGDLPAGDVLVMDIEGSEISVLRGDFGRPREIVVEYHADKGASRSRVEDILSQKGYRTVSNEIEIEERGIGVVRCVLIE